MNGSKCRSFVPQSALIQPPLAGSQLWFELRGRKEFYLKSGKPQEVTLSSSCHCIPANRQTIHQPTHMCSRDCGETHCPTNTARLPADDRVWWVIYIPRLVITQTDTHKDDPHSPKKKTSFTAHGVLAHLGKCTELLGAKSRLIQLSTVKQAEMKPERMEKTIYF